MGQEANTAREWGSQKGRVTEIKAQIVTKRGQLAVELDELRRRRVAALQQSKRVAIVAGVGAVSLIAIGSITRAAFDLFLPEAKKEKVVPETSGATNSSGEEERKPLILLMALGALRWLAATYGQQALEQVTNKVVEGFNKPANRDSSGRLSLSSAPNSKTLTP